MAQTDVTPITADGIPISAYCKQVGEISVTAFRDGYFDLPISYFAGLDSLESERLLQIASAPFRLASMSTRS